MEHEVELLESRVADLASHVRHLNEKLARLEAKNQIITQLIPEVSRLLAWADVQIKNVE